MSNFGDENLNATDINPTVSAVIGAITSNPELFVTLSALIVKGLWPAAKALVQWVNAQDDEKVNHPLEDIPIEQAPEVAAVFEAANKISSNTPGRVLTTKAGVIEMLPEQRQAGLGVTRRDGKLRPVVLLPRAPGDAETRKVVSRVEYRTVGFAAADSPDAEETEPLHWMFHRPGRPIAHRHGQAGSLGLYVTYDDEGRDIAGFVGASHVLNNLRGANVGDMILSPGPPPAKYLNILYEYGALHSGRILVHHTDHAAKDVVINRCDVAFATIKNGTIPCENSVPDPNSPEKNLLRVDDVVSEDEITDYLAKEVFLVGRSTRFACGRFDIASIKEFAIRMPDRRNYMFGGLGAVAASNAGRFSRPGDSGALIYTLEDGNRCRALGFVVGGNNDYTFFTPAATAMNAVNVRLYDAL